MIFNSRKATATAYGALIITILSALLPALGAPEDVVQAALVIVGFILGTYNVGQGLADFGKEAQAQDEQS